MNGATTQAQESGIRNNRGEVDGIRIDENPGGFNTDENHGDKLGLTLKSLAENCAQARRQVSNLPLCVFLGDLNREAPTLSREAPTLKSLAEKCTQTRAPVSKLHCLENVKILITSFARKHRL